MADGTLELEIDGLGSTYHHAEVRLVDENGELLVDLGLAREATVGSSF